MSKVLEVPRLNSLAQKLQAGLKIDTPAKEDTKGNNSTLTNEEFLDLKRVIGNTFEYTLTELDFAFLDGNCVNGNIMFPVSGCLVLTWCALAKLNGKTVLETPIIFKHVHFKNIVFDSNILKLKVTLLNSGMFEIYYSDVTVATGTINVIDDPTKERFSAKVDYTSKETLSPLSLEDIYKELAIRGYSYSDTFQGIHSCDHLFNSGVLNWNNNWTSFIDTMLQYDNLRVNNSDLYLPIRLDRLLIDPNAHVTSVLGNHNTVPVKAYAGLNMIVAGGVEIEGVQWSIEPRNTRQQARCVKHVIQCHKDGLSRQELKDNLQEVEHAYVGVSTTGDLAKMRWIISTLHLSEPSSKLCQVYYTALNHQDFMTAKQTGVKQSVNQERRLGVEFSGITSSGKRVMGIVKSGGLATEVIPEKPFIWEVPSNWSLKKAASVPIAYVTAYFALVVKAQIKPNQTIVVYSRANDLALVAIRLALHIGCKVYPTRDARDYLKTRFLEIPLKDTGLDWDPNFERMVLERTGYHGADVVINFLGDSKISAGMRCLAAGGKFLQVGQLDSDNISHNLDISIFENNKSFQRVQIDSMSEAEKGLVARYIEDGICNGHVFPGLHVECYFPDQLEEAFSCLLDDNRFSKIMIAIRQEEPDPNHVSRKIQTLPQIYMKPDKTYIIIDGVQGLGIELAQWLVMRGATKLVLSSKDGVLTGYQHLCIRRLQEKGVSVFVSTVDCTTKEGAEDLLIEAEALGPLGGVFDVTALNILTSADIDQESIKDSVKGIKVIDKATQEQLKMDLDHFVIFVPTPDDHKDTKLVSTIIDIVEKRKKSGHPGKVVCLGGIDGILNAGKTVGGRLDSINSVPQQIDSITEALDSLLTRPHTAVEVKLVLHQ